ncbi:MAG TPA: transglycosylase domain-containing protein [Puia sp.]|nr:transglycosylase domain-containing protein [Puia sp.]
MKKATFLKSALGKLAFRLYVASLFRLKGMEARIRTDICKRLGEEEGVAVRMDSIKMGPAGGVTVRGIGISYNNAVSITITRLKVRINLPELLKGRFRIGSLIMEGLKLGFEPPAAGRPSRSAGTKDPGKETPHPKRYDEWAFRALNSFFRYLPDHIRIDDAAIDLRTRKGSFSFQFRDILLANGSYRMSLSSPQQLFTPIAVKGRIDARKGILAIDEWSPLALGGEFEFNWKDTRTVFTTAACSLIIRKKSSFNYNISLDIKDFEILNGVLSVKKVKLYGFGIHLDCLRGKDFFELQDTSAMIYNSLTFGLFLRYLPAKQYLEIKAGAKDISPVDLLSSFPDFTHRELYDFPCSGVFSVELFGAHFIKDPAKSSFQCKLADDRLIVDTTKDSAFSKLNSSSFGSIKLAQIPEILYKTIISTEDPNFYAHKGIDPAFIGYAILQNVERGKIARGGSTITMQLSRNLFLGRNRTIYRKIEEIVITWMLESVFKLSKNRILEIYLNIIEFAPNVYGIEDACRYYFSKDVRDLSVTECLVLSYIIPRPRHFEKAFMSGSGQLRTNLKNHIDFVSKSLFLDGILSVDDLRTLGSSVSIRNKTLHLTERIEH